MKKLSRLDIRKIVTEKAENINESMGNRMQAIQQAMASIENQYGAGAISRPGFDAIMMQQMKRSRSADIVQDIALAYDLMIKHAPGIVNDPNPAGFDTVGPDAMRRAVGEIQNKTSLDKRFISFHLRKAVQAERDGRLTGLPTGQDLVTKIMDEKQAAEKKKADHLAATTEMIGGRRITIKPAAGRGKGRPTYGHTSIGTDFAPDGMSDEEAVKHLSDRYAGAPMWKFEISRDPDSGKIYAYYEIDTSG